MLAITGGKGGAGKTTATLGLAQALATRGGSPLVVDADTDLPDLHLLADVDREPTAAALADGRPSETVAQHSPTVPGVRVVPAGPQARTGEALRHAGEWPGPVLVDCPAGASADATVPLRHCDGSVLVTVARPQTLADAAKTARMAERLDASPVAALVRGTRESLPFSVPHVERAPSVTVDDHPARPRTVLRDPRYRLACESLVRRTSDTALAAGTHALG